jgi:hypothetical protein
MFDWPFEAVTVGFQTQWKKPKKNQKTKCNLAAM